MTFKYYFKHGTKTYLLAWDERLKTTEGTPDRSMAFFWTDRSKALSETKESRKDADFNAGIRWKLVRVPWTKNAPTPRTNRPKIVLDAGSVGALLGGLIGGFTSAFLGKENKTPNTRRHCQHATKGCYATDATNSTRRSCGCSCDNCRSLGSPFQGG